APDRRARYLLMSERSLGNETTPILPFPRAGHLETKLDGHIPALDGVRGLAILLVLIVHSVDRWAPRTGTESLLWHLALWGWSVVVLLLVLPGFLTPAFLRPPRARPHSLRTFPPRRALRIFPLYYGTVLLCLVLLPLVPLAALDWLHDLSG